MKHPMLFVKLAVSVLCFAGFSFAKPLTAGELLGMCLAVSDVAGRPFKSDPHSVEGISERGYAKLYCMGWILGATDEIQIFEGIRMGAAKRVLDEGSATPDWSSFHICLPVEGDQIDNQTVVDSVVNYIRRHPKDKASTARIEILNALAEAFPCKDLEQNICRYVPCTPKREQPRKGRP